MNGIVESLHIVRRKRGRPEPLASTLLVAGRGIEGDHHDRPGVRRAITLIRAETLEEVGRKLGAAIPAGASRRNLVVRGLDLDRLATGTRLRLGEAMVEVRGACDPCEKMEASIGPGAFALLERRGGIFVRVLEGGALRTGDAVTVSAPGMDESPRAHFQAPLLAWFRGHKRDLPWRRTEDPYAIWVSEVMLQQTRVDTAIPYYERFLERFPTVQSLAAAPLDDVCAKWSGLGYYARARNLHKAAQQVVERHGGKLPADLSALRELPGFGPYTAGAVGSIGLGLDAPLVDGNVARVLCRLEGWEVGAEEALRRAWELAPSLIPSGEAGDYNQALMELGATVCTPGEPGCSACPVRAHCRSAARGEAGTYPLPKIRRARTPLHLSALIVRGARGAVLMERRDERGLFGGLWQPPSVEVASPAEAPEAASRLALELVGHSSVARVGVVTQALTHRDVTIELFEAASAPLHLREGSRLVAPLDLPALGLSTLVAKTLQAAGVAVPEGHGRRRAKVPDRQQSLF